MTLASVGNVVDADYHHDSGPFGLMPQGSDSPAVRRQCGRASRVEIVEGHARSGDVRANKNAGDPLPWAPGN
jgi:hypothetical protein